nr:hypothetical protein [Tanacetum cinerariifolium]
MILESLIMLMMMKLVEEEVDMNNVVSSYTIPDAPLTKFLKDHPKDQGHTQEEGIDYDEVFSPVARIEAIRLFLAYASFKDFVVYQIDVKSDFLYEKIEDESGEDPDFPDKVYKVEKALYGLHQAPRACQDKYAADILKKFYFFIIKTASTLMEPNKALVKDAEAKDVDVHLYRSMIGSLMYLTASRRDITFSVCACARIQVTPKTLHLHAVKRIFRYLKGKPKLGLWYPKDSPFDLEAYADSDYARASLDRKSITGDETVYKEWEDIMERVAATASSLEAEQDSGNINRTQSMAILNEPLPQGTGSGSGPRRHLKLKNSNGISTLPNTKILEKLALIGVPTPPHDSPLPGGHTPKSDEGSLTLNELTVLCITFSNKVESLETELKLTKQTYGVAFTKLVKKVKKLEKTIKTSQARRRAKIVISDDDMVSEDSSKQRRMIEEIDQDVGVILVSLTKVSSQEDQPEDQLGVLSALRYLQMQIEFTLIVEEEEQLVLAVLRERQERARYKAAIRLQEQQDEEENKRISRDVEITQRLQEETDATERQRMAQVHQAAQTFIKDEWDNIRARVEANEKLTQRLQAEERENTVKMIEQRLLLISSIKERSSLLNKELKPRGTRQ